MPQSIDRRSFILGMITAFSECVAAECKKAAFSPPFYEDDYKAIGNEAKIIAQEQGIKVWYEENLDMPASGRVCWFVIYKFPEALEEYLALREMGYNPAWNFAEFKGILSYGIVWGKKAKEVVPQMRGGGSIMGTATRVLLRPGEWPPERG
jgi:hypothetical protein